MSILILRIIRWVICLLLLSCKCLLGSLDSVLYWVNGLQIFSPILWVFFSFSWFPLKHRSWTFCFLGPYLWHVEIPKLGVKSELQLLAYTTATEMQDLSCVCHVHHSSWQRQILNPLSRTGIEPASSWVLIRFITAVLQWELLESFTF